MFGASPVRGARAEPGPAAPAARSAELPEERPPAPWYGPALAWLVSFVEWIRRAALALLGMA